MINQKKSTFRFRSRGAILRICVALFFSLFLGCNKSDDSLDVSGFKAISQPMIFESLAPAKPYDFYEFRNGDCVDKEYFRIIHTVGTACPSTTGDCTEDLNTLVSEVQGYSIGCLPGCCADYVVAREGNDFFLFDTLEEFQSFLGTIDSESDALNLIEAMGYFYRYDDVGASGIKTTSSGYQIIALRTVKYCLPVQTDQFLLDISFEGVVTIIEQRTFNVSEGVCV